MKAPDQATVDARYQAKLAARATGATPVRIDEPQIDLITGMEPAAIDARYRAKMAARKKGPEAPAVAAPAVAAPEADRSAAHDGLPSSKAAIADEPDPVASKETKPEGSFSQRQRR
jgi:hypothetical protein